MLNAIRQDTEKKYIISNHVVNSWILSVALINVNSVLAINLFKK